MYKKKRTSKQRFKGQSEPLLRRKQRQEKENTGWINKLSLQLICCFLILSAARGNGLLPEGKVLDAMDSLLEYGATDYSTKQVAAAVSRGVSALITADSSPQMVWPCNEAETMALAADSSSKAYSFSSADREMQVYAACGGTVQEILDGRIVISHGNGLETVYDGCTNVYVQTLQKVRKGEMIASIVKGEGEQPQLSFQILKEQQAVDIGDYLHED